jgi:putative ABC transport system substrate-binding protein
MRRRELVLVLGCAMTVARPLRAQQKALPVIGFLGVATAAVYAPWIAAFRRGLDETGYVEGKNVTIEYRWAENHVDRLPALAADLVARKVDVIMTTGGTNGILAAKGATATIPIVAITAFDNLVATGLVASLAHPGGNLTGLSILVSELTPKRFELLSELVPQAKVIAVLVNPNLLNPWLGEVQEAARAKAVELPLLKASTESEIDAAFISLGELHVGALLVGADPFFNNRREQIVALAAHYAVPTSYEWRESLAAGGLISYGPSNTDTWRQAGVYVGKILKGAKPADLPIQQPTKFELVINLNTAKALGLTVPPGMLDLADEVIE